MCGSKINIWHHCSLVENCSDAMKKLSEIKAELVDNATLKHRDNPIIIRTGLLSPYIFA